MIDMLFTSIRDFILNTFFSNVMIKKHHLADKNMLEKAIDDVLSRYKEEFDNYNLTEEFDYQGLLNYVKQSMMPDVEEYLYATNRHERKRKHDHIIKKGIAYSSAKSSDSRTNARKLLENLLDTIKDVNITNIDSGSRLMANEIVGNVEDIIESHDEKTQAKIEELSSKVNSITERPESSNPSDIKKFLQIKEMDVSKSHILFPEYGYKLENDDLYSRPLSTTAEKKYPPHFEGMAELYICGNKISALDNEAITLSYRKQQPIEVHIKDIKKMLGNIEDPIQTEAERLKGEILYIKPAPFPDAFAVKLICGGNVIFDYIKLRTQSILDDGTFIVTNDEQKHAKFSFKLTLNPETKRVDCSIVSNTPETRILLSIAQFIKCCVQHQKLEFKYLESGEPFLEGFVNIHSKENQAELIDNEIELLEDILVLEEYYHKSIGDNRKITEKDYDLILYAASLIKGEEIATHWSELSFPIVVEEHTKSNYEKMKEGNQELTYIGSVTFQLLGEEYKLPISRTFRNLDAKNYERTIQKLNVSDIGDPMNMVFVAHNDDGVFIDRLYEGEIPSDIS